VWSLVKIPKPANDNLLGKTLAVWQPRSRRKLSREDVREIAENVTGFFSVLVDWSRVENARPVNDNCVPAAGKADEDGHAG
jgi:hypothetical protein